MMSTRCHRACFTTIGVLLVAAPAIAAKPVTRVEFRLSSRGRIEIPVQVDAVPAIFTVDTASEWSTIGPRLAAELHNPKDVVRGREFVNDISIGLGNVVLRHQRLALLSSNDSSVACGRWRHRGGSHWPFRP